MQERVRFPRHMAALIASLVDFQKTQVFFIITVEIAVLVALYDGAYLNASSWAELWINLRSLGAIADAGLHSIVFGMLLLRKAGKLSCYVSVASACCVLVSSITWFKSYTASVNPTQITHTVIGLHECFEQAPSQYCFVEDSGFQAYETRVRSTDVFLWAVTPMIMLVMLAEKMMLVSTGAGQSMARRAGNVTAPWLSKLPRCKTIHIRWLGRCLRITLYLAAEGWLVVRVCFGIFKYFEMLPLTVGETDDGRWGLGQIIAVAVWVPVVVEYLYLSFCKSLMYSE
jgi:hypothetical protein